MNYRNYRLIIDICVSVCEALSYMLEHEDERDMLMESCRLSMSSIEDKLNEEKKAVISENIFPMLADIQKGMESGETAAELLKKASKFALECESGLEYKIRVLFVAELGGKWDAMESVYEAFMKRDDCIVDVVLEPVFREVRLPDGSVRHEEANYDWLTPKGIKHIPYEKYDMKKIRPDITFFSQPYESCTVPMFWPKNMAKYTRVVYLPYFTANTLSDISSAYNSFFKLPTQKYSWAIACQSEAMKRHYEQYASQHGKNVLVTGLPKWDYVYRLNKKSIHMPKEWQKKLNGRTVFLWNTHFAADISGSKIFSPDGMEFLKIFINDPKLALIWRPHPMMDTVVELYYPEENKEIYRNMKHIFKISENMIIDKNESYDAAFVYSDALISDFSSMIDQYLFLNKPILMLTANDEEYEMRRINSGNDLSDFGKIAFADSLEKKKIFIRNVISNKGCYIEKQSSIFKDYYYLSDGNSGTRFTNAVLDKYKSEIMKPYRMTDVLIIGSLEDSEECVHLFKDNNVDYYLCDMLLDKSEVFNNDCFSLDDIFKFDYDCILITAKSGYDFLREILIKDYKVDNDKIIVFERVYNACIPNMVVDRVMSNPNNDSYDGMILGTSRTEAGIITDKLDGNFCNLSVSSQDLYYQYQTLLYCKEKYYDKIKNLKVAIIDLYDYYYFSYDTSLSRSAIKYFDYFGGFINDKHNYDNNKNFENTWEDVTNYAENKRFVGVADSHIKLWNKYLKNIFGYTNCRGLQENNDLKGRFKIVEDAEIDAYNYSSGACMNIFDKAIKENTEAFSKMIMTLKEVNPDIKIYAVVLPKYSETEARHTDNLKKHKDYFEQLVSDLQKKFGFTYLNFKEISDMSSKRNYYYDETHLNTYGAYKFTLDLNDMIAKREK